MHTFKTCRRFYPNREFGSSAIRTILSHNYIKKIKKVNSKTGKARKGSNLNVNTRKQIQMQNTDFNMSVHQKDITRIKMITETKIPK